MKPLPPRFPPTAGAKLWILLYDGGGFNLSDVNKAKDLLAGSGGVVFLERDCPYGVAPGEPHNHPPGQVVGKSPRPDKDG